MSCAIINVAFQCSFKWSIINYKKGGGVGRHLSVAGRKAFHGVGHPLGHAVVGDVGVLASRIAVVDEAEMQTCFWHQRQNLIFKQLENACQGFSSKQPSQAVPDLVNCYLYPRDMPFPIMVQKLCTTILRVGSVLLGEINIEYSSSL